eukprot:Nk52_evm40s224 gene=Nk52_evmTU40s224
MSLLTFQIGQCGNQIGCELWRKFIVEDAEGEFSKNGEKTSQRVFMDSEYSKLNCIAVDSESKPIEQCREMHAKTTGKKQKKKRKQNNTKPNSSCSSRNDDKCGSNKQKKSSEHGRGNSFGEYSGENLFCYKGSPFGGNFSHGFFGPAGPCSSTCDHNDNEEEELEGDQPLNKPISRSSGGGGRMRALAGQNMYTEFLESIMDQTRRTLERCDACMGVLYLNSVTGGTGGGFGARLMQESKDLFNLNKSYNACVLPFAAGENPMQSYNQILYFGGLARDKTIDNYILFNNDHIYKDLKVSQSGRSNHAQSSCSPLLNHGSVTLSDMNGYIADCLYNVLGYGEVSSGGSLPLLFGSSLSGLTCMERLNYFDIHTASGHSNEGWGNLASDLIGRERFHYSMSETEYLDMMTSICLDETGNALGLGERSLAKRSHCVNAVLIASGEPNRDPFWMKAEEILTKIKKCLKPASWHPNAVDMLHTGQGNSVYAIHDLPSSLFKRDIEMDRFRTGDITRANSYGLNHSLFHLNNCDRIVKSITTGNPPATARRQLSLCSNNGRRILQTFGRFCCKGEMMFHNSAYIHWYRKYHQNLSTARSAPGPFHQSGIDAFETFEDLFESSLEEMYNITDAYVEALST